MNSSNFSQKVRHVQMKFSEFPALMWILVLLTGYISINYVIDFYRNKDDLVNLQQAEILGETDPPSAIQECVWDDDDPMLQCGNNKSSGTLGLGDTIRMSGDIEIRPLDGDPNDANTTWGAIFFVTGKIDSFPLLRYYASHCPWGGVGDSGYCGETSKGTFDFSAPGTEVVRDGITNYIEDGIGHNLDFQQKFPGFVSVNFDSEGSIHFPVPYLGTAVGYAHIDWKEALNTSSFRSESKYAAIDEHFEPDVRWYPDVNVDSTHVSTVAVGDYQTLVEPVDEYCDTDPFFQVDEVQDIIEESGYMEGDEVVSNEYLLNLEMETYTKQQMCEMAENGSLDGDIDAFDFSCIPDCEVCDVPPGGTTNCFECPEDQIKTELVCDWFPCEWNPSDPTCRQYRCDYLPITETHCGKTIYFCEGNNSWYEQDSSGLYCEVLQDVYCTRRTETTPPCDPYTQECSCSDGGTGKVFQDKYSQYYGDTVCKIKDYNGQQVPQDVPDTCNGADKNCDFEYAQVNQGRDSCDPSNGNLDYWCEINYTDDTHFYQEMDKNMKIDDVDINGGISIIRQAWINEQRWLLQTPDPDTGQIPRICHRENFGILLKMGLRQYDSAECDTFWDQNCDRVYTLDEVIAEANTFSGDSCSIEKIFQPTCWGECGSEGGMGEPPPDEDGNGWDDGGDDDVPGDPTSGGIPACLGVQVVNNGAGSGTPIYNLSSESEWWDEERSGGLHHIYVSVKNNSGGLVGGIPFVVSWADGSETLYTNTDPNSPANFAMYGTLGSYSVYIADGTSDRVTNLGMGTCEQPGFTIHTSFNLIFDQQNGTTGLNNSSSSEIYASGAKVLGASSDYKQIEMTYPWFGTALEIWEILVRRKFNPLSESELEENEVEEIGYFCSEEERDPLADWLWCKGVLSYDEWEFYLGEDYDTPTDCGEGEEVPEPPPTDSDDDGIPDESDLCPYIQNDEAGNQDPDGDGIGNACDNCWYDKNPDQADNDGDCPPLSFYQSYDENPQCGDVCQDLEPEMCSDDTNYNRNPSFNPLSKDYTPEDLESVRNWDRGSFNVGSQVKLRNCNNLKSDLEALMQAAQASSTGKNLAICSGYRSWCDQYKVCMNTNKCPTDAQAPQSCPVNKVAVPGTSEHQLGITLDFCTRENGWRLCTIEDTQDPSYEYCYEEIAFENTNAGSWILTNAENYGFTCTYCDNPSLKETWHYRYTRQ